MGTTLCTRIVMAPLKSWLNIDSSSHFSIHNLPFGIISTARNPDAHVAVAIGDYAGLTHLCPAQWGAKILFMIPIPNEKNQLKKQNTNHKSYKRTHDGTWRAKLSFRSNLGLCGCFSRCPH